MVAKIVIFLAIIIAVLVIFRFIKVLQGPGRKLDNGGDRAADPVSLEKCSNCDAFVQPGKRCGNCGTLKD